MSKKKNTLKDLDEFLKQQAATLVTPEKLSDKIDVLPTTPPPAAAPTPKEEKAPEVTHPQASLPRRIDAQTIVEYLDVLHNENPIGFRQQLYDILIRSVEARGEFTPEDKMLINTALYLKSGERWKDVIRDYWRKHAAA